jgi:hypothetical protein
MKVLKWVAIGAVAYIGLVVAFEIYLATAQPAFANAGIPILVLTTTDESGVSVDRRLARFESDGKVYVSAHHWPRVWHRRVLEYPQVRVTFDGTVGEYTAVAVEGEEYERFVAKHPLPLPIRILMGFPPPRDILRLDPRS